MAACNVRSAVTQTLRGLRGTRGHLRHIAAARQQWDRSVTSQTGQGKHSACWVTVRHESIGGDLQSTQRRRGGGGGGGGGGGRRRRRGVLWAAVAFSLFSRSDEDQRDEAQRKEDDIILLLKKAKLSVYRGQLQAASGFLHQAVALAHQTHNTQAIIYTYSLMANLAYVQGQLDSAEKLFKAAMSFLLSGGTPQDDNAVIEMSLKLATIYAEQNKVELAEHGFRFCLESLEAKLQNQKETAAEELTEEQEALRKETRLLLGLCLDSRARYRASSLQLEQAGRDYQKALDICCSEQGDRHPQTLVLMSDLATILDLQGRHDDALALVQQAVDLSRSAGHPDQHVLLGNMAGILLHTGRLQDSVQLYHEALSLAQQAGDQEAVTQIQEGLEEVKKRRKQQQEEEEEKTDPQ
ncbi:LOW QUALITY PROTEIN: tetratricopeptide repeat protein 19, mitochondrial [Perca fluviatilis]|uniref:LOW QUALITY PROTEIN: tetratricopeptide repeat protein 19, mitochondrial n=1 Tax=Perca fluviatilis TaxID=8168 RepID=UPI001962586B|nr:LOW QUALITY PROTEIN: tetratricopeptide repeat protein 19, mitochondrial [Perca fluviatilis]